MLQREIIEDIVILLRGFFATPMISSLGRLGVLTQMRAKENFSAQDFPEVKNPKLLEDTFRYFRRIGLVESVGGKEDVYRSTELGKEIFRRANSFYVPHSYYEYLGKYHEFIQDPSIKAECAVERLENVIGSGITHQRYFPPVISFLKRKVEFDVLADVGCGDGQFLSAFLKMVPGKDVVGVDLSRLSTDTTAKNLKKQYPDKDITTVCCDAMDADRWSKDVLRVAGKRKVAISMWFLLHEISRNDPDVLIKFFNHIHRIFPDSTIMIGEVVRQSEEILISQNARSIMSEYLFFHEMSGQGILAWEGYREVLENIPYELVFERLFDEAPDSQGNKIPSTLVWGIVPK